MSAAALYRTLWRWHFYAGLFVIPFVLLLALSGTVFLFKPQVDRWEERAFQNLPLAGTVAPGLQVQAALDAFPGARMHSFRLAARDGDASMVHLALADGRMRDVFVAPRGEVLGSLDPETRLIAVMRKVHGQLLLGPRGSWLVELAASWAIVMIISGVYLWWPRGRGLAGVLWPRRRTLLRDLHAVTGFWVAGFTLVLLLTGLPWADVWGRSFQAVRTRMGWVQGTSDWTVGGQTSGGHAAHEHSAMHTLPDAPPDLLQLDRIVVRAASEHLPAPVVVVPPGAPQAFGAMALASWTVRSDTQIRPQGVTINFDGQAREISRSVFTDKHPLDQVVGYGTAWHEGQLFGAINQAIGVLTAAALVTLSISGFLMWRRRRPAGALGAPALPADQRKPAAVALIVLLLALLLPLLAASLLLLCLTDQMLPRVSPRAAHWLGMQPRSRA
ncbi:MAG: PepSY domain-containing protein [Steroidobacteraceae bacterium]